MDPKKDECEAETPVITYVTNNNPAQIDVSLMIFKDGKVEATQIPDQDHYRSYAGTSSIEPTKVSSLAERLMEATRGMEDNIRDAIGSDLPYVIIHSLEINYKDQRKKVFWQDKKKSDLPKSLEQELNKIRHQTIWPKKKG